MWKKNTDTQGDDAIAVQNEFNSTDISKLDD